MSKKIDKFITIATLIGILLAVIIGFTAPSFASQIKVFGDRYIKALKFVIGPIIFCSMSLFILKTDKRSKFILAQTVLLFIIMFILTYLISSLVVWIAKPGTYFKVDGSKTLDKYADFNITSILSNFIPKSLEDFFFGKSIFFIIVCALVISLIISFTKIKTKYTICLEKFKNFVDVIIKVIMTLTPIAVVSLISNMFATYDVATFKVGLTYILYAYGLSILAILLVMILPVWIIAKINPLTYIRKVAKVWLITITTCSSAATLPYTIKTCNEDFGIDEKVTDVVVPLGCTIHMCGGAVSFSLLGLFVAQLSGITITFPMFLLMILFATLINMAAPGIPGGGVVIGMSYLSIFGFPYEAFYGLYVAIYKFLDMAYTTLNVTGDISANILLDHFAKIKHKK